MASESRHRGYVPRQDGEETTTSRRAVVEEFQTLAGYYHQQRAFSHSFQAQRKMVLSLLGSGSGLVLDIGAGPALLQPNIVSLGYTYVGMDLVPEMLLLAKQRLSHCEGYGVVGNAEQLPFDDNSFTAVVAMGVLEYTEDLHQAISEIRRVLVDEIGRAHV
jgi:ubiquinone/menaquinone biosynthesis C-methylase UbiE